MQRLVIGLLVLALILVLLPFSPSQAQTQAFSEDFTSTIYMDAAHTTAHWDSASGLLKLAPTEPIAVHLIGGHSWRYPCALPAVWSRTPRPCILPIAPAVYVSETHRAYQFSNEILEYDPQRNLAVPLSFSGPAPHKNYATAAYASRVGKAYIFGGCVGPSDMGHRHIYEFDPIASTNTLLSVELPYPLRDAAAAYVPDTNKIYIFGGRTPDGQSADVVEFDVAAQTAHVLNAQLPYARSHVAAVFAAETNRIYVFGGNTPAALVDEILAFDPSTKQLSLLDTRLPIGVQKAAAAYLPRTGDVLIMGGERQLQQGPGPSNRVFAFNVWRESIQETADGLSASLIDPAAIYAPEFDWLAVLGGRVYGTSAGVVRLRWDGSALTQWDSFLPWKTHTSSAVYVPEHNSVYLFGGERAQILQFDLATSLVHTMSATLPVPSSNPGLVWVPPEQRAHVFDPSGIYTYDPASDTLVTVAAQLPDGYDPRTAVYAPTRNAIYLFDSADGAGSILRFNLSDHTLVTLDAHLMPPRRNAYAVYVPATDLVFVMGGWGYQSENYLADIMVFDVSSETLSQQQDRWMPLPGEYKASLHMPTTNNIFLLGGWGGWSEEYAFPFAGIWHFDTTPIRHFVGHALTLTELLGRQAGVWVSAEDRFYTFGGLGKMSVPIRYSTDWIYRFDCGHAEEGVAQSMSINRDSAAVLRATLSVSERLSGGSVDYFLSNNDGATWEAVTPGVEHTFASEGSNLRWKAVLHGDGIETPMVDELAIEWSGEEPTPTHTPTGTQIPTSTATPTATATEPTYPLYLPIVIRS
jgi:hypothetical protein